MTLAPIIEPAPGEMLSFEAAAKWGAWCFALDPADATTRLQRAAHAGALRVWRGGGSAPAQVSLEEVARWQEHAPPGRVFDSDRAMPLDLPGPLRMRWRDARAALADELHARAPALTAEQAAALAAVPADAWANATGALKRLQTKIAQIVPSPTAQRGLVVVAVALNLVPVAERQADGSVVPIVLEPWQAWDLPGAQTASGDELVAGWNPLSWGWLHRVPWQADADGPAVRDVPPPWAGWTVADWKEGPFLLHVSRLLAALRALASDRTRCHARGITPPEIVEPLPAAQRWTPATEAIAVADPTARGAAIGAAIRSGALPVALRLPQRSAGAPPEDVPVPPALLRCLALDQAGDAATFDWAAAVTIGDAVEAEAAVRAAVVCIAPYRRGRDKATQWKGVGLAVRPGELRVALQAGEIKRPTAESNNAPRPTRGELDQMATRFACDQIATKRQPPTRADAIRNLMDAGAKKTEAEDILAKLPAGLKQGRGRKRSGKSNRLK